jgi:predicted N-acetyltransferase YhbS
LRTLVNQYERRNLGRTYVATEGEDQQVLGYDTLSSGSVSFDVLPAKQAKKLPRHEVPVILLARLAVDQRAQGKGLGGHRLGDAIRRSLDLSESLGIHAIVVDAIDESARSFYRKFGFIPLLDDELHLFLPIAAARSVS